MNLSPSSPDPTHGIPISLEGEGRNTISLQDRLLGS